MVDVGHDETIILATLKAGTGLNLEA